MRGIWRLQELLDDVNLSRRSTCTKRWKKMNVRAKGRAVEPFIWEGIHGGVKEGTDDCWEGGEFHGELRNAG